MIDARKMWSVDRSKYLNASEALSCVRKQWFAKHDGPDRRLGLGLRPARDPRREVCRRDAARSGLELMFAGDDQSSVADDVRMISATPDGVLYHASGAHIALEIKTVDPRTNRANLPRREHVVQIQLGIELLREQRGLDIESGLILYMDASNYNQLDIYPIGDATPASCPTWRRERGSCCGRETSTSSIARAGTTGACKTCPFAERCGVDLTETKAFTRSNRGSALDVAVRRFVELVEEMNMLSDEKAALSEDIKVELRKRNTSSTVVGDIEVELTSVEHMLNEVDDRTIATSS